MESELELLAILVIGLLLVAPVLAIMALVRVSALKKVSDEAPRLVSRIYALEQRLDIFERKLRSLSAEQTQPAPAAPQREVTAGAPAPPPAPIVAPAPSVVPPRPASPTPAMPFRTKASLSQASQSDVESMIAGQWMYYVGILALGLAVTFFLKYAFDNNWIGPAGRVAIGLLIGSALFPLSHWILRRGYRYFSEGIAGLGAAILYLAIWAGWHYYALFTQSTAFTLMIVVTAAVTLVAIGRNSERIAALALIGGALTPILVSTGHNEEISLFTYLAILGAGMLVIAWKREWKSLPPLLFAATLIYFWGWYSEFYATAELARTMWFAAVFFVMFGVLPAIRGAREGELPTTELALVLANASNYLIALRAMLWPEYRWGLTVAVLALSAAHLLAERALQQREGNASRIARAVYAGLALVFATLAIPIRLDGHWVTLAWAAEAAVLVWSGLRIKSVMMRGAGLLMFLIVGIRLVGVPIERSPVFLLNARFLTLAFCAGAAAAAFVFAKRSAVELQDIETGAYIGLAIAANFCFLLALSLESWDLYGRLPSLGMDRNLAQELALSMLWMVYAITMIIPGAIRKSAALRWQGLALLGVTVLKVFFIDLSFLARFYRIVSFLVLGLVLLLVSFYYQRQMAAKSGEKR
ncbi:MAG TPA: DUF2339 domain-containing protein [Candidatus Acidoferrales bacterium]|nr:DUF2339 domain-containing protein [Candidatus Acidoferrales bacterium]